MMFFLTFSKSTKISIILVVFSTICHHHSPVELWESLNDLNGYSLFEAESLNWN